MGNMGVFSESDSERAVREHNEGQDAGSKADGVDKFAHRVWGSTGYSEAYNRGWENGVNNPAPIDDDDGDGDDETYSGNESHETRENYGGSGASSSSSGHSGSSNSSSGTSESSGVPLILVVVVIGGVIILGNWGMNRFKAMEWGSKGKQEVRMMGVNTTMLNVRSGPGTTSTIIAKFAQGARLATTGEPVLVNGNEQWVRVSTEDGSVQGWVNLKFLSTSPQQEQNVSIDKQEVEAGNQNGEVPRQENDYVPPGVSLNDTSKLSPEKCQELINSVVLVNPDLTFSVRNVDIPPECTQQLNDKYRLLQEKTNERNRMLKDRRRQM